MKLFLVFMAIVATALCTENSCTSKPYIFGIETYDAADASPETADFVMGKGDSDPCKAKVRFYNCEKDTEKFDKYLRKECGYDEKIIEAPKYISFFNEFRLREVEDMWECILDGAFKVGIETPAEILQCIEITRTLIDPVGSTTLSTSQSTTMTTTQPPTTTMSTTPTTTPLPSGDSVKIRFAGLISNKKTCVARLEFGEKKDKERYEKKVTKCMEKSEKNEGFNPKKEKSFLEDNVKGSINNYFACLKKEAEKLDSLYGTWELDQCIFITNGILGYIDLPAIENFE